MRFVIEIEDHPGIRFVGGCHRGPKGRSVIFISHQLLTTCQGRPGRVPMEVKDWNNAGGLENRDIVRYSTLIVHTAIGSGHAVDTKPAVFVQGHTNSIDIPCLHGGNGRCSIGPIKNSPTLGAGIFGTGSIGSKQAQYLSTSIDKVVPHD